MFLDPRLKVILTYILINKFVLHLLIRQRYKLKVTMLQLCY